MCNVWGESHYMTFDGKTYNFTENCSYYLVKEIITKYNLTIIVNRDCDSSNSTSCVHTLTVIYRSTQVVFTQLETSITPTNVVSNDSNFYTFVVVLIVSHLIIYFEGTDFH